MEALPKLPPVRGHLLTPHEYPHPRHLRLAFGDRRQLPGRPVEPELDEALAVHLLEALRSDVDQSGRHLLGRLCRDPDGETDQRNARRTFDSSDSSSGSRRFSSVSDSRSSASSSRWRSLRLRGITTFSTTRWSPRRPRPIVGIPRPRRVTTVPGCVPARTSTSSSPSSVGTVTDAPSAAAGAGTSTTVTRSLPSRRKRSSSATPTST